MPKSLHFLKSKNYELIKQKINDVQIRKIKEHIVVRFAINILDVHVLRIIFDTGYKPKSDRDNSIDQFLKLVFNNSRVDTEIFEILKLIIAHGGKSSRDTLSLSIITKNAQIVSIISKLNPVHDKTTFINAIKSNNINILHTVNAIGSVPYNWIDEFGQAFKTNDYKIIKTAIILGCRPITDHGYLFADYREIKNDVAKKIIILLCCLQQYYPSTKYYPSARYYPCIYNDAYICRDVRVLIEKNEDNIREKINKEAESLCDESSCVATYDDLINVLFVDVNCIKIIFEYYKVNQLINTVPYIIPNWINKL